MHKAFWYFGITSLVLSLVLLPLIGFFATNTATPPAPSNGIFVTILNVFATFLNAQSTSLVAPVAFTVVPVFIGFGELLFFVTGIVFTAVGWPRAGSRGK